jgi:hypothetical protein
VDRLRCLGNGQVPGVVRLAWRILAGGADMNIANDKLMHGAPEKPKK